jgi:methylenetetrahydrofolate reductase (NADPH)
LSCVGSTRDNVRALLFAYKDMGIKHIVALRGDLPSGMHSIGEFQYANELVSFIRAQTGEHFHIEVAAYPEFHPQAKSARDDMLNFKRKMNAGANSAITQYFYNADAYFSFVDETRKLGVTAPIVPGIMPVVRFSQLARFSDNCGAEIPRWIRKTMEGYGDDQESVQKFGLDVVTRLCEKLIAGGAPGMHFYTLNQATASVEILKRLGYRA